MSGDMRPELSPNSEFWIERHRYYELKHFCLQYRAWKRMVALLDGYSETAMPDAVKSGEIGDPTAKYAERREEYVRHIELLESVAERTDPTLARYLLTGVTEGISYDYLKSRLDVPCCRETYYHLYRAFFWLLDKERG